ncbi:hypothetical protein FLONG3_7346 [Fusarium longipes]|uniref:Uncharacterized protein n=1 Tax=Fusarium longipes TaxID=694270 RepID=A0A395SER5_9HYPO|nr:hypothetical protein FLONG3_7346 [Fusarium longipes]
MGGGNHDESFDYGMEASAPHAQSQTQAYEQESHEQTSSKWEDIIDHTGKEGEDVTSSDDEDELVLVDAQVVDAVELSVTSQATYPGESSPSNGKRKVLKGQQRLIFDNMEMIDVPDEDGPEEDYLEHSAKLDRQSLSTYDIPIGPFESEGYDQKIVTDKQMSLFYRTFMASARLAQSSIGNVTGSVMYTAQCGRDAASITNQAGKYLANGALNAGQSVMIRVQESWPTWPRGFNGGILALSELLMEGIRSLPPSDAIIRPQGRQMTW